MSAIFDFEFRRIFGARGVGGGGGFGSGEAEALRRHAGEDSFDGVEGAVGENVDCVDDVVEQRLAGLVEVTIGDIGKRTTGGKPKCSVRSS